MSLAVGRRRFLVSTGATMAGAIGCSEGSPARKKLECGTEADGGGLGYCLLEKRELRVIGAARLAPNQAMMTGIDDQTAVIVARDDRGFYARSAICTHSCCVVVMCNDDACSTPVTSPEACAAPTATPLVVSVDGIAFICTCHGSAFRADGSVLTGPATAGLPAVKLRFDGTDVVVDISQRAADDERL